jgi:hypothetical protein
VKSNQFQFFAFSIHLSPNTERISAQNRNEEKFKLWRNDAEDVFCSFSIASNVQFSDAEEQI